MEYQRDLQSLLLSNYMPYAEETIVDRAIPYIDGLKPVQRRLLYIMYDLGLLGPNMQPKKSQKIVGATMSLHPHGDSSIYDAMKLLTTGYEGQNVPLVQSKGSFGKKYSRDLQASAARYTEAKLADICKEIFEGIHEDSVEFIDNFDGSEKEPSLLPVKFPLVLTNTSDGVAVAVSSYIPTFSLKNVCNATIAVLSNQIKEAGDLAPILKAPEFTTGAYVHTSDEKMKKLCETGRGSFVITSVIKAYNDRLEVEQIPYTTTAEDIIDKIIENQEKGKLRNIKNVRDEIGLDGLKIVIELKPKTDINMTLRELYLLTPLRDSVTFRTRVIIDGRYKEVNILELIHEWIRFRQQCIRNIYKFRLNKDNSIEAKLSVWTKIIGHPEIVDYIVAERDKIEDKNVYKRNYTADMNKKLLSEVKAKLKAINANESIKEISRIIAESDNETFFDNVKNRWNLTDAETEYITEMKQKSVNSDNVAKDFVELVDCRNRIAYCNKVIAEDAEVNSIIKKELKYVVDTYGCDDKTNPIRELTAEDTRMPEEKISNEAVTIVLTKNGYVRRLLRISDLASKFETENDYEVLRWSEKNDQYILVFDRFGVVHKVAVNDIDASHGKLTDKLYKLAGLESSDDMIWADACGDYSKRFYIIYPNGHGTTVHYSKAMGSRKQYKGCFAEVQKGGYFLTFEEKFFLITARNKATFVNLEYYGLANGRSAFKSGRLYGSDYFTRLIPYSKVPNVENIDLAKYSKDYTVAIRNDVLWEDPEAKKRQEELNKKLENYYNNNETSENEVENTENN